MPLLRSIAASATFSSCMRRLASSSSSAISPSYRSGASATKPSSAKRSQTSRMWSTRPHHSWMTITPGPDPPSGIARYAPVSPASVRYSMCSPTLTSALASRSSIDVGLCQAPLGFRR